MLEVWWWPIAVWVMSSLTLTTGVGAGVVYTPVLTLAMGFDIETAIATSIIVQLAGVTTTAAGHLRERRTDRRLAFLLGTLATIGVAVGVAMSDIIPIVGTEIVFVAGMSAVGVWLVTGHRIPLPMPPQGSPEAPTSTVRVVDGAEYTFCRPTHGYALSAIAGLGTALLGISGAEIQISSLMLRCGVPSRIAVATGTAATAITIAAAAIVMIATGRVAWDIAGIAIPAAIVGSFTARRVAHHLPQNGLRIGVGLLGVASAVGLTLRAIFV